MNIEILSPSKTIFKGEVSEVIVPSVNGEAGILPQHTEYLTALQEGKLTVKQPDGPKEFNITGGLLTVETDKITVLVDGLVA